MTTLKQRFEELKRDRPDVSQADLARATKAKPPSVNAWFTGETKTMKVETAEAAAAIYGVSPLWLSTGKGPKKVTRTDGHAVGSISPVMLSAPVGIAEGVEVISAALAKMTDAQREIMAGKLASLARAPDSATLKKSILDSMSLAAATVLQDPQLTNEEKERAKRLTEAAHAAETISLSRHDEKKSTT